MTPERAANLLHLQIRFGFDTDHLKEAYRIGQAAIERCMVAKKPVKDKGQHIRYISTYSCPSCGGGFSGTGVVKHCYHCGQLIDWSDTECI